MNQFKVKDDVFVATGYMDCQGHPQGYQGTVVSVTGKRYLVRNENGVTEYCQENELSPLREGLLH